MDNFPNQPPANGPQPQVVSPEQQQQHRHQQQQQQQEQQHQFLQGGYHGQQMAMPSLPNTTADPQPFSGVSLSSAMEDSHMVGGDSLDDIIQENSHSLSRRSSTHRSFAAATAHRASAPNTPFRMNFSGTFNNNGNSSHGGSAHASADGNGAFGNLQFPDMATAGNGALDGSMAARFSSMENSMSIPTTEQPGTFTQASMLTMADTGEEFSNMSADMMESLLAFPDLTTSGPMQPNPSDSLDLFSPTMGSLFSPTSLSPMATPFNMGTSQANLQPLNAASAQPTSASLGLGDEDEEMVGNVGSEFRYPAPDASSTPHQQQQQEEQTREQHQYQHQHQHQQLQQQQQQQEQQQQQQQQQQKQQQQLTNPFGSSFSSDLPAQLADARGPFQPPVTTAPPLAGEPNTPQPSAAPDLSLISRPMAAVATTSAAAAASTAPATPVPPPSSSATAARPSVDVYSKTGFDMVRALYYVATRPNPQVHLGAVDFSCAFVVCDVTQSDCPIIYVSDNFQNLTGYSRYEILGQNCRFLQAPNGVVEPGSFREFVANDAVFNLKNKIDGRMEVQQSLINYRKGGKPFLNLLTMIPIPWEEEDVVRYYIGFQIDLVEWPEAIAGVSGGMQVNYCRNEVPQYIWNPPDSHTSESDNGQTFGADEVSKLLQQYHPKGNVSEWFRQSWDKMLLENTDDVIHVLSLKGLFMYLSPSCKRMLGYDAAELVGRPLSEICHPSDIVPVMRELKDAQVGSPVNLVFRIMRKCGGYTWFESHGSLFLEQGKGRKCVILAGREYPVFALNRRDLEAKGGIGDSEMWSKLSTSGLILFVTPSARSLLDLQPEVLQGTSIQDLMRKETRDEFGRCIAMARKGKIVMCKHEVSNRRGQVLQAQTMLYPKGPAEKPTFLIAQTKLLKASRSNILGSSPVSPGAKSAAGALGEGMGMMANARGMAGAINPDAGRANSGALVTGSQAAALAADDNFFDELGATRCTSWQYELRQMEKMNRVLAEELHQLQANKKKRKRRKGVGNVARDCANCHTRNTPEWRRGPSGQRDLCNSCGLRWAKQMGRVSPRNSSKGGNGDSLSKKSTSPLHPSSLQRDIPSELNHILAEPASSVRSSIASSNTSVPGPGASAPPPGGTVPPGPPMPPPSQPLLEGGSGLAGAGMEMAAIREEREPDPELRGHVSSDQSLYDTSNSRSTSSQDMVSGS